nr:uncharacterized protein LOC108124287 [Drosophila bipectinata]
MSKYFSRIAAVYGLIIVIMLRIVLPFILVHGRDTKIYSKQLTASVVGFYLSVSIVMTIIITMYPISTRLASLTKDWIVIGRLEWGASGSRPVEDTFQFIHCPAVNGGGFRAVAT